MTGPVVICDDHLLFAESLALVLERHGYDVAELTTSPFEAAEAVRRHNAGLCIMDLQFPGCNGTGVDGARMVREHRPDIVIVMLSASSDAVALGEAIAAGVTGFARKDQPVERVLDIISQVVRGEVVIDPSLLRAAITAGNRPMNDAERLASFLTAREREVIRHLTEGHSTERIAAEMAVAYSTARTHIQNSLVKLGVHSRLEASALAVTHGLHLAPPEAGPTRKPLVNGSS